MDGAVVETPTPSAAEPAPPPPSAPAAEPQAERPSNPLARLSRDEHDTFMRTGELPPGSVEGRPAPAKKDEPAPAANDDDQPAVNAKGEQIRDASGKFVSKRQQRLNESIARGVESGIATERAARETAERRARELETELTTLRSGQQPPKPAAEPAKVTADQDPEPQWKDFENDPKIADPFIAYHDARAKWNARQEWKRLQGESEAKARETQATTELNAVIDGHLDREKAILATVPDYADKVRDIRDFVGMALDKGSELARTMLESPVSELMLLHYAAHRDEFDSLKRLTPFAAARAVGKLEASLSTPASRAADPPAPAAPKKTVTSAPEPPTTLGTRPAEPANAAHAAVASGRFSDFDAIETQKDLARFGSRR